MKKRFNTILKRPADNASSVAAAAAPSETDMKALVKSFCDSGAPDALPSIVEAASANPKSAEVAAKALRKMLPQYPSADTGHQYNAIMLLRILSDNPGPTFTKHIDAKFRDNLRFTLRWSKDPSVQQILGETMVEFQKKSEKDENLKPVVQMWNQQKTVQNSYHNLQHSQSIAWANSSAQRGQSQGQGQGQGSTAVATHLPPPAELAGRVEEAKTTARLLMQLTQSTPPQDFLRNELIKEFADRCRSAKKNLEAYMNVTDPPPDEATFMTLIETCEQLNVATSKHQRALLAARKATGSSPQRLAEVPGTQPPPQPLVEVPGVQQSPILLSSPPLPSAQLAPPPSQQNVYAKTQAQSQYPVHRQQNGAVDARNPPIASLTVQNEPNPFSDDNQIKSMFDPSARSSQYSTPGVERAEILQSTAGASSNAIELPAEGQAAWRTSARDMYLPPQGPPPNVTKKSIELDSRQVNGTVQDDDEDMYNLPSATEPRERQVAQPAQTSAITAAEPSKLTARPIPVATVSNPYPPVADESPEAVENPRTALWGEMDSPVRTRAKDAQPRVRDDDPPPVVGGVSGTGWHY